MYQFKPCHFVVAFLWVLTGIAGCKQEKKPVAYEVTEPLVLVGQHDKVISGLDIAGDTLDCIELNKCYNLTIKNCRFRFSKKNGITIFSSRNIKVVDCYFEKLSSGVYAVECQQINISYNRFKNIQGPFPRGQFVQFDEVTGAGNKINYNIGENFPGQSGPEDAINVYKSKGTAVSPIEVIGNRIRGGGPSTIGGGIMLGDNGGAYIIAKDNILVNPGQYGMAIAGGDHITIIDNVIYGKKQPFTNVGLYIWNQSKLGCQLNTISGNSVNFTKADGTPNNSWNQGNCGKVQGWETNQLNAKIDSALLPPDILSAK